MKERYIDFDVMVFDLEIRLPYKKAGKQFRCDKYGVVYSNVQDIPYKQLSNEHKRYLNKSWGEEFFVIEE